MIYMACGDGGKNRNVVEVKHTLLKHIAVSMIESIQNQIQKKRMSVIFVEERDGIGRLL